MTSYYKFIKRDIAENGAIIATYAPTIHAQGAWNINEQHMAPATGIICEELSQFSPRENMRIARLSFDILGLINLSEFTIKTQIIRAGKTIELIEAIMSANGKDCIIARAWRIITQDTKAIAGLEDKAIKHPDNYPIWNGMSHWPGGFIKSINVKVDENHRAGCGIVWINNNLQIVEGQNSSDFVLLMGMVDTANGIVPRQLGGNFEWAFPNLDLQIHLYRQPQGQWLGLQTTQQYGEDGIGLTSSILHDEIGPFGRSEQILTLRKF